MIARLIKPDGTIAREWATDRPDLAHTADRNFPAGWRVVIYNPPTSIYPEARDRD
jgi:hypothetical protein